MNRRTFLSRLAALAGAPVAAKVVAEVEAEPEPPIERVGYLRTDQPLERGPVWRPVQTEASGDSQWTVYNRIELNVREALR